MIEGVVSNDMEIIGISKKLKTILRVVEEKIAPSDASVVVFGETGSGKESIAKRLHFKSPRSKEPLVVVNCGAIPPGLEDSFLFGHTKGAFTGAIDNREGAFERANKGTIFLDEIAELSLASQAKLLRVLQEKEFTPVGGTSLKKSDFRFVCATHEDLLEMVKKGKFREDLYYRINVISIKIPALKDRMDDVIPLLEYFFKKHCSPGQIIPDIDLNLKSILLSHNWPGNVRELENIVRRFLVLGASRDVFLEFLNPQEKSRVLTLEKIGKMESGLNERLINLKKQEDVLALRWAQFEAERSSFVPKKQIKSHQFILGMVAKVVEERLLPLSDKYLFLTLGEYITGVKKMFVETLLGSDWYDGDIMLVSRVLRCSVKLIEEIGITDTLKGGDIFCLSDFPSRRNLKFLDYIKSLEKVFVLRCVLKNNFNISKSLIDLGISEKEMKKILK